MLCPRVAKRSSYCNMRGVLGWQLTRCIVTAWKLCIQINAHPLVSKQRVKNKRMKRKRWEFSPLLSNQWDIYASFCAIIRLCHALTEKGTSCIDFWHKPVHFRVKKRTVLLTFIWEGERSPEKLAVLNLHTFWHWKLTHINQNFKPRHRFHSLMNHRGYFA